MCKFLVVYEYDIDEGEGSPVIETSNQIFNKMDMDDCYPIRVKYLYWLKEKPFELIPCEFYGTWHKFKDPLLMEIVRSDTGETVVCGHGTDH